MQYIIKHCKVQYIRFIWAELIMNMNLCTDRQSQWLREGGLEEGGEGRQQSEEAPEEEGEQSSS